MASDRRRRDPLARYRSPRPFRTSAQEDRPPAESSPTKVDDEARAPYVDLVDLPSAATQPRASLGEGSSTAYTRLARGCTVPLRSSGSPRAAFRKPPAETQPAAFLGGRERS